MALGATSQEIGRKLDESRVWGEIQAAFQDEWLDFWEDHTDYDFLEGSAARITDFGRQTRESRRMISRRSGTLTWM